MTQFASLGLAAPILATLADEGYETPTPIQAQAIPPVLLGRDILGCAQTGTGKTAAFALPILQRLLSAPADKTRRGPALARALILSPTRELATQIADSFATYGKNTGLSGVVIYGGVSQLKQVRQLQRGVDVIVATPGRLMDLMEQGYVDFSAVTTLVLDEADRMLDMGFIEPIRRIAGALPSPRQTLMFSATMPKGIQRLAESLLRDPVRVAVSPVASAAPLIEQSVYMVHRGGKQALLEHTLEEGKIGRALVFTRTKHGADKVAVSLNRAGISATAIHGNKAQNQRQRALDGFRAGRSRVLVATDVAARGLDVDGITHVFNFDIPHEPEAYVHRIGRTGRAGASGFAISFCDHAERGSLRDIERLTGKPFTPITKLPAMARRPDVAPILTTPLHPHSAPHAHAPRHEPRHPPAHAPARRPDETRTNRDVRPGHAPSRRPDEMPTNRDARLVQTLSRRPEETRPSRDARPAPRTSPRPDTRSYGAPGHSGAGQRPPQRAGYGTKTIPPANPRSANHGARAGAPGPASGPGRNPGGHPKNAHPQGRGAPRRGNDKRAPARIGQGVSRPSSR